MPLPGPKWRGKLPSSKRQVPGLGLWVSEKVMRAALDTPSGDLDDREEAVSSVYHHPL